METTIDELEKWDDTALVDAFQKAMKSYPNEYEGREDTVEAAVEATAKDEDDKKEDDAAEKRFAQLLQRGTPSDTIDPSSGYGTWQPAQPSMSQTSVPPPLHPPVSTGDDGLSDLLASWYYAGYYTGRYRAFQEMQSQNKSTS
uniref:Survival Motor Neuron Gemin2-binding domain-containing protein n=1 Tax=Aureoumbra lagunensis TaxID=44058 RepID=A0A7S3K5F0_9STRA|mmetsp:Transcript_9475/g.13110  ORF Transcript_9475/g.13110 Transcript_9475/m.13110 type:complete len:143 (-) Transcript_9475:498-926(-)|eukprot:CAMPEP_0197291108 /NCGR_PEP_ID=MMETSP0890-20130614/11672_1 /TAXON_ID=44058 ORGANISM="Aureoumbra lagunensis, Strain CCMP1510" /NCGR_SAMPLE_ID=MMETSP0890 /ASSEMBLY_ACC=CAM_ASM_000533 /LENGTH=142 /DNA_ID=CAMNT_0042763691 /DNA_START=55 /DNA_END=486 /DNA_ORIENTATION=+